MTSGAGTLIQIKQSSQAQRHSISSLDLSNTWFVNNRQLNSDWSVRINTTEALGPMASCSWHPITSSFRAVSAVKTTTRTTLMTPGSSPSAKRQEAEVSENIMVPKGHKKNDRICRNSLSLKPPCLYENGKPPASASHPVSCATYQNTCHTTINLCCVHVRKHC